MKIKQWRWWLTVLAVAFVVLARADNPIIQPPGCIENGPYTNAIECIQDATSVPGVLTPYIDVVVGQQVFQPIAYDYSMTNGQTLYYVTYDCPETGPNYYFTNQSTYTFGNPYFVPELPTVFWTPGTYTYTDLVVSAGSPCSTQTNVLGTVTVTVSDDNPDVLFDVDFGGAPQTSKTGYAASGNSASDFWNYYIPGGNTASGALPNLATAEGDVSPVGMSVNNLPVSGSNGSPDAMYNDYLSTADGEVATVTITNLPSGLWNIYLYSDDSFFGLTVSDTNNGIIEDYGEACYDLPLSSPLVWKQGLQYVLFPDVFVGPGQTVTVTVAPGLTGTASISGLQIASASRTLNSVPPISGIIAWWKGEGNTLDSAGTNNGMPQGGVSYALGEVGQTFSFNGSGSVMAAASPSLDVGQSDGFTIEGWISSPTTAAQQILWEWQNTENGSFGVHMQTGTGSGGGGSAGGLFANIVDTDGSYHFLWSNPGILVANQFQYIALTYDQTSGIGTLYVNGSVVAQSDIGIFTPQTSYDFYMGERLGSGLNYTGFEDEISIYNRALSTNEIRAIYLAGADGKSPNPTVDSDYDGVGDLQEMVDRTDPFNPNSVSPICLGSWSFDDAFFWSGDAGQLPLMAANIIGIPSWNDNGVLVDSTTPAVLCYRDVETNGDANINLRCGSVRFWFAPDWSSGNVDGAGPGDYGRLIEMGSNSPVLTSGTPSWTIDDSNGWWSLFFAPDGTQLVFGSSTNGAGGVNLSANIAWASDEWHEIVLTYSPTNSLLYLDEALAASGAGSIYYPNLLERGAGFTIGSDGDGNSQAHGAFADLETFNYPLSAGWVANDYMNSLEAADGSTQESAGGTLLVTGQNASTPALSTSTIITSTANPSCLNSTVTFTATVTAGVNHPVTSGSAQFLNGTSVLGTVNLNTGGQASLTIGTLTAGAHTIKAVFSGSSGYATSSGTLNQTINAPPSVTGPQNVTVCSGSTASLKVSATGTSSYQWMVNTGNGIFTDVSTGTGGKTSTYTISSVPVSDSGYQFQCQVSGAGACSILSSPATLTVNGIVTQPVSQYMCLNGSVTFSVVANGSGLAYQWYVKTNASYVAISGAMASNYTIGSVQTTNAGNYRCTVGIAGCSSQTSADAVLTVNSTPVPTITSGPANQSVLTGSSATFGVSANDATSYQWQVQVSTGSGFNDVSTATVGNMATYATPALTIGANGYVYRCMITGPGGCSITSPSAALTVADAPGDSDGDGLPDWWETQYFSHLNVSLTADPNNSGLTVLQDYQLGLNPTLDQTSQTGILRNYSYDLLDRLTSETGEAQVTITPDKEGNITGIAP